MLEIPPLADGELMLIQRDIATVDYTLGRTVRYNLRIRPDLLRNLQFQMRFEGEPGVGSILFANAPWGVVRRIKISTPRGEVYKDFEPVHMNWLNRFEYGTAEYNTFDAIAPAGTVIYFSDLICPFENHTGRYWPEETVLNTNESTEIWIDVTWGDVDTDIWTTAAVATDALELHIIPLERQPVNISDRLTPRKKMIDLSDVREWAAGSTELEIQYLLPENSMIKTILIAVYGVLGGVRDNYLTRAQIVDDDNANVWFNMRGDEIQSENKSYYGVESQMLALPGGQTLTGLYVIEFDQMKDLTSCYNTAGKNYPKLLLNLDRGPGLPEILIGIFIRQITTPPALQIVPAHPQETKALKSARVQPLPVIAPIQGGQATLLDV